MTSLISLSGVDVFCIDQANMDERNMLFTNITKMFAVAEGLCIWLGDSSLDGRLAINFLKSTNLDHLVAVAKQTRAAEQFAAGFEFMKRPWYTRRCSVRDFALSLLAVDLYCGPDMKS